MDTRRGGHGEHNNGPRCRECGADSHKARGLCRPCYRRFMYANPDVERLPTPRKYADDQACGAPGCDRERAKHRPYCRAHDDRLRNHGNFVGVKPKGLTLRERWERHLPDERLPDACWEWRGGKNAAGYGVMHEMAAHRAAYILHVGPIPEGRFILHGCDNPPCVNPAHLRAGTPADNAQDMKSRGRAVSGTLRLTDEQRAWVVSAIAGGMTAVAAAKTVGIHPAYACRLARTAGVR